MRVGVDLNPMRPPFTGVSNYELWLLDALLDAAPSITFDGFAHRSWRPVDRPFLASLVDAGTKGFPAASSGVGGLGSRVAGARMKALRALRASPTLHAAAAYLRARFFDASLPSRNLDLFHAFMYRAPSRGPAVPVIPVVYDLSHLRHPETHPIARIRWMRFVGEACRGAPAVHTISRFSAREIEHLLGVDPSRIHVVLPSVGPFYRAPASAERRKRTLATHGLRENAYAVTVSTLEPRKNLRTLLDAYAGLDSSEAAAMPLAVVGPPGWGKLDLPADVRRLLAGGSVRLLGYVSDAELADLYGGARVMLYPSLYEGFGMPITEALACGAPVVASDAASMPEALGGNGRLVAPLDVEGWRHEIRRALETSDMLADALRAARRAAATAWTWQDAAERVRVMYEVASSTARA